SQAVTSIFFSEQTEQLMIGSLKITNNLNKNYDKIFEELLLKKINNFDINDIHQKVIENIKIRCNFDKPKIVILNP
ncbi:8415_t:CDS:1, partial [Racocetra fulgida]